MEIIVGGQRMETEFTGTAGGLLKELKLLREECVVRINGSIVPETARPDDKDKVEIIRISSRG